MDVFSNLDGDGNTGSLHGLLLSYDVEDRLTSANNQSLTYRPDGLRAIQNDGSAVRTYIYDGAAPIEELDGAGNVVADHEYGPTGYLGHNDHGPFTTFTSDPTGNGIQTYSLAQGLGPVTYPMGAYGVLGGTNIPSPNFKLKNDFYYGWNGYTGLIGMGARNYDPQTGRFITRDPLGYGGGMNLYAFGDGDPINNNDPFGLFPGDSNPLGDMFQGWDNAAQQAMNNLREGTRSWSDALSFAGGFACGVGPNRNTYRPNSLQSQQLKKSLAGDQIRREIAQGKMKDGIGTVDAFKYSISEPGNGTEVQVGAFGWTATPTPDGILVHAHNNASWNSLVYHLPELSNKIFSNNTDYIPRGPEQWERFQSGFGPFGNVHQDFYWLEPK